MLRFLGFFASITLLTFVGGIVDTLLELPHISMTQHMTISINALLIYLLMTGFYPSTKI
jgi:hypothetical protein